MLPSAHAAVVERNPPPHHRLHKEWRGETREAAERQTFWNEFFNVLGVRRRTVASFEEPIRKLSGDWGHIDLFWPGKLIVEHRSARADPWQGPLPSRALHPRPRRRRARGQRSPAG